MTARRPLANIRWWLPRRILISTVCASALLACSGGDGSTRAPGSDPNQPNPAIADGRVKLDPDGYFSPSDYFVLIEASPRNYRISSDLPAVVTHLGPMPGEGPFADPMWILARDGDDPVLATQSLPDAASAAMQAADSAFASGNFELARSKYTEALAAAPGHAKLTCFLGNTYYALEEFAKAAELLEAAAIANPIDYQVHLFLADTYAMLGRMDDALNSIVRAHVYNPNHAMIREHLAVYAEAAGKRIDDRRLSFAYEVTAMSDGSIAIHYGSEEPEVVLLGVCDAAWLGEPELRALESNEVLGVRRVGDCLSSAVMLAAARLEDHETLSPQIRWLHDAAVGGSLDAIVFWDYAGRRAPALIAMLPPELIAKIESYIHTWVLRPA